MMSETKERPILFSAPMVRAILSGRKTQTRRAMSPQPKPWGGFGGLQLPGYCSSTEDGFRTGVPIFKPKFGKPGDRLWVREAWRTLDVHDRIPPRELTADYRVWYEAEVGLSSVRGLTQQGKVRPGMFMPRWASRITLEVTEVRVERLHDISEADAQAEGCALECMTPTGDDGGSAIHGPGGFLALWESINGAGSWDANPWVWVVSFRRLRPASREDRPAHLAERGGFEPPVLETSTPDFEPDTHAAHMART